MTMAKKLPLLAPSIHTFEVNERIPIAKQSALYFMAIQKNGIRWKILSDSVSWLLEKRLLL